MLNQGEYGGTIIKRRGIDFGAIIDIVFVVLIALTVAFIWRTQVTMSRGVDGRSMQPTYNNTAEYYGGVHDTVRITKLSPIRRGDIVVFEAKGLLGSDGKPKLLIKRVIGKGGDTLKFTQGENGTVEIYRNGGLLSEPYIKRNADGAPLFEYNKNGKWKYELNKEFPVPKGCYFVMGDNRNDSTDSRFESVDFIASSQIEGKVYLDVPYGENVISALWDKVFG